MNRRENNSECCEFCGRHISKVTKVASSPNGILICDECVEECLDYFNDDVSSGDSSLVNLTTPKNIKKALDDYIIGQEDAKKILSVAVYNHYKRINFNEQSKGKKKEKRDIELKKSNILMLGPTGSGKTLLAQTLSKVLNVPFAVADATTLTEAGYVGEDVENILLKLIQNADYDIKRAEIGIIYIDEIDKISKKSENTSITRDVSGEGVQQALLKIIESTVASVPPQGGRKHPQQEFLQIDTTNILFIFGGAFVGLEKIIESRKNGKSMGFGGNVRTVVELTASQAFKEVQPQDLVKCGLIPEFVGRVPVTVGLHSLDKEALINILTKPKDALIKQYELLFEMDGIKLIFEDDAIDAIAAKAIKLETGARGLRTVIENCMTEIMYTAPSDESILSVTVTKDVVENNAMPLLEKKEAVVA